MAAAGVDETRLEALIREEDAEFACTHPRSSQLALQAKDGLLGGVVMPWQVRSAGRFPLTVVEGQGARFTCADGRQYIDFCLGDTGAMAGHSPAPTVAAIQQRAAKGLTFMLPSEDAVPVARLLQHRFGLPFWQLALTATDANRFSIRLARLATGRSKILVFNWCYHGTVDETFATLGPDGSVEARPGNLGPPVHPSLTTKVVEWNDVAALEAALAPGDVACVLAEPAMTNIGIILPEPGYLAALRDACTRTGTLLLIDETHTICAGPGGMARIECLQPDIFVLGKPIAGGIPVAVYGFTADLAARLGGAIQDDLSDTGGVGGTLAGNALSLAALRATLEEVLTQEAYDHMISLAQRFEAGVSAAITRHRLPWVVKRLGCRVEYWPAAVAPRNGGEAAAAANERLDYFMHLAAINRGIYLTPFHNMALMCPATTAADVDRHTAVFEDSLALLLGGTQRSRL